MALMGASTCQAADTREGGAHHHAPRPQAAPALCLGAHGGRPALACLWPFQPEKPGIQGHFPGVARDSSWPWVCRRLRAGCQVLTRVLVMGGPPQCCSGPHPRQRGQHVTPPPASHLLGTSLCSLSPGSTVPRSLHLSIRTLAPGGPSSEQPEAQALPCSSNTQQQGQNLDM